MNCLNKNTLEYQTLKKMSGISEFKLDSTISYFLDNYGRYPELDEIPGADSENYLKNSIGVKDSYGIPHTSAEQILQYTGSTTIPEANKTLNNKFKDLEINLSEVLDKVLVRIDKRPNAYRNLDKNSNFDRDTSITKKTSVLVSTLGKFQKLYGINIIPINNDILATEEWQNVVSDAKTTNAFIYNGNIYVNTDIASLDAPIHELLHMFLGAMRFTNPEVYFNIIYQVRNLSNIADIAKVYKDRTESDLLEEVFVSEFAKFITGQNSFINELDSNIINTLLYNITRNLDTMLMGNYSTKSLDPNKVLNASINELSDMVESELTSSIHIDYMDKAALHRKMSNTKSELLRSGKLIENCE